MFAHLQRRRRLVRQPRPPFVRPSRARVREHVVQVRLQVRAQSFISLRLRAGPRRGLDARAHARPVLEHGVVVLARAVATRERAARARGAGGDERRGMAHVVERARLEDDRENEAKSADAIETTRRNGSNPSARGTRARLARVRRSTRDAKTRRKNYATARSQLAKIKINASLTPAARRRPRGAARPPSRRRARARAEPPRARSSPAPATARARVARPLKWIHRRRLPKRSRRAPPATRPSSRSRRPSPARPAAASRSARTPPPASERARVPARDSREFPRRSLAIASTSPASRPPVGSPSVRRAVSRRPSRRRRWKNLASAFARAHRVARASRSRRAHRHGLERARVARGRRFQARDRRARVAHRAAVCRRRGARHPGVKI